MDTQIYTALSSLEVKLNNLLSSITSSATASGAPAAALSLLEADDDLTNTLQTLRAHQSNHLKILRLRNEAQDLEDKVKNTVRDVITLGSEISTCRANDGSTSDSDEDSEDENDDTDMGGVPEGPGAQKRNEVDYKLLLDFARRISRYNTQAAADVASGLPAKLPEARRREPLPESSDEPQQGKTGVGVAALSQETVNWLDETTNWLKSASQLPFPSEENIRMGLMGQLHAASAEGKDPEQEIVRMIATAEGKLDENETKSHAPGGPEGSFEPRTSVNPTAEFSLAHDTKKGTPPPSKQKAKLDLDLYDPDDDDA